ncbi:DUF6950 family protein [Bradyrhizobium sp. BR 10261]|uniref:DUF6950 family protein n=1 Tax=Bradyrhizobium sp. BR 10261 TaxID=2749992 RepID=UPI001C648EE9|nr:hypothetical protein [Bradyrhizobium sp. BR 10261]MBW7967587.1 hypothetical protein [Bradyrhizobium sp. BR 10261]
MLLADYLASAAARDFAYGQFDCAILMADWLMACGWPDAMPDRRGTYSTERAFRAAVRSEGGLVASCRRRFARIGLREASQPRHGDVALALVPFARRRGRWLRRPTGALVLDGGGLVVMAQSPRGVVAARLPLLVSWSASHA